MVDWGIACLLAATAVPKSVARTMDAANCAAVLLSAPISYHFLRLYSATGRARRRKWRYIKYTPLPLPFTLHWRVTIDQVLSFNLFNAFIFIRDNRKQSGSCSATKRSGPNPDLTHCARRIRASAA